MEPGINQTMAIQKVPGSTESVLTGATIAQIGDDRFLYVADIRQGKIAVYDTNFNRLKSVSTLSMMSMVGTLSTMRISRKGSLRSMCKTSGTISTCLLLSLKALDPGRTADQRKRCRGYHRDR
jgi:hypothetical protein